MLCILYYLQFFFRVALHKTFKVDVAMNGGVYVCECKRQFLSFHFLSLVNILVFSAAGNTVATLTMMTIMMATAVGSVL